MNKMIIFGLFCSIQYLVFAQTPANYSHWQLKWEDQFDTFNINIWKKANNGVCGEKKEPENEPDESNN
jgi:hypothetical protein